MGDKLAVVMATKTSREANQLLLIPVAVFDNKSSHKVAWSWAMRMFMTGCLILLLLAIPFYITCWVIHFIHGCFAPICTLLGIDLFGVGFVTSATFLFFIVAFKPTSQDHAMVTAIKVRKPERRSYKEISYPEIPSLPLHVTLEKPFQNEKISGHGEKSLMKWGEESNIEHATTELTVTFISRKPAENEIVISKTVSRSQDQAKVTAIKNYSGEDKLRCVYLPSNHLHIGVISLVNANVEVKPNLFTWEGIDGYQNSLLLGLWHQKAHDPNLIAKLMRQDKIITLEKQFEKENISGQGEKCLMKREESDIEHTTTIDCKEGALNSGKTSRKIEAKESLIKRLCKEGGASKSKRVAEKQKGVNEKQFVNENISGQGEKSLMKREESDIEHTTAEFTEICVQDTKTMLKKLQVKEDPPPATLVCKERALNRETEAKESPIKRLSKEGGASKIKSVAEKLGALKSGKKSRKTDAKASPIRSLSKEGGAKECKKSAEKLEQKDAVTSRKSTKKEIMKCGSASRSQDQAKVTARKARKPENGLYWTRNQITHEQNTTPNASSNRTKQSVNHTSNNRKRSLTKRAKPVSHQISAKLTTEDEGCEENDNGVNFRCKKKDSILAFDDNAWADQLPELEELYTFQIGEHLNDGQILRNALHQLLEEVDETVEILRSRSKLGVLVDIEKAVSDLEKLVGIN